MYFSCCFLFSFCLSGCMTVAQATVLMEASLRTITNSACSRKPYQYDKSLIL